jgi:hypothetical protein
MIALHVIDTHFECKFSSQTAFYDVERNICWALEPVSNLSWGVSWQDLKDHFRGAGTVVYADVMKEQGGTRSKGCGIVEYESPSEAGPAVYSPPRHPHAL